ncbi:hypothetical protein [Streptacidiphilus jiangxiensis]|uniref:PknH-like extracellular domain-containing protein n=1 Tax=Streptacidiphilus jiangxiensis TaxID=235985 RepID=A0A1H7JT64_STRJI|nr:hypothetical protein [Streptacidiphilus jiangxiensis]SEK77506.1 hypothetical protein SAMN05414137_103436 [Streptacidiphilus jiangxiensis]
MTTHLRRVAAAALCAGAALALTACSSGGGSTATAGSAASAGSGTSASAAADPTAGLPNGTKLAGWLLPGSVVPKLKANPKVVNNSGDTFVEPSDTPLTKSKACDLLNGTTWMNAGGLGPAAFAGTDFDDSYGNEYYQELDAFEGTRATQEFAGLSKVFTECRTFPMTTGGATYTMHLKVKELPGLGDEAIEAVVTSPSLTGGQTMVAIRSGKVLVTTSYNDQSGTGAQALTLARRLLKKLPAAAG